MPKASAPMPPATVTFGQALSCAWPALLLAAALLLPFLNKPFLIDDPHFLKMATQIVSSPLHPMDFTVCWNIGERCMKAYELTPGNALMGYALVPTVLLGSREWVAHLTQLVLCFVAILAMASLSLRWGCTRRQTTISALLLVTIPPLLPMAATAMPDILALTLAVLSIERMLAWKSERRWQQGVAAAFALGLAGFARSHLVLLLPLAAFGLLEAGAFASIRHQLRKDVQRWLPILAGALVLAAVIAGTRERSLALDPPSTVSGLQYVSHNAHTYLFYLVFPIPLALAWFAASWRRGRAWLLGAALLAIPATLRYGRQGTAEVFSAIALLDLLRQAVLARDFRVAFLLLWVLIPLPIVFYGHLPIKYFLPVLPAVILLLFWFAEAFPWKQAEAAFLALILLSGGYSGLLLIADADFAQFGRGAVEGLVRPPVAEGKRVWYGLDFSFYWYAPRAGAQLMINGGPGPQPGDLWLVGSYEGSALRDRFPHRTLVRSVFWEPRFGLTMGRGVGLYSNQWGIWLWGRSAPNENRWELWRIDRLDSP